MTDKIKGYNPPPDMDESKIPAMPPCKPPRVNSKEDAAIKMQMAKDMVCALINSGRTGEVTNNSIIDEFCSMSEQIFDRFNK